MNWEIWSEGYQATGEHGRAMLHGRVVAATFLAACQALSVQDPEFAKWFTLAPLSYWGCRLFPTEEEARRAFG